MRRRTTNPLAAAVTLIVAAALVCDFKQEKRPQINNVHKMKLSHITDTSTYNTEESENKDRFCKIKIHLNC